MKKIKKERGGKIKSDKRSSKKELQQDVIKEKEGTIQNYLLNNKESSKIIKKNPNIYLSNHDFIFF